MADILLADTYMIAVLGALVKFYTEKRGDKRLDLKEFRARAGLRQIDVAKKLNVTPMAVSNWENGLNKIARKYHKKLAKLYGCTVDELLAGDETEK